MLSRALPAALLALLLAPACTLDLDREEDPVVGAADAGGWDEPSPDAGSFPGAPDAGTIDPRPGGDAGTPACDAGRPIPDDAGVPPAGDGGTDPWPPRDGGTDPWPVPDAGGGWPVPEDAGTGSDCAGIASEAVCIVSPGCVAWYEGIDCVCDDEGACECVEWVYSHCE